MSKTGTTIVTLALREIGVLDPTAVADGEQLADAIEAASDLLDLWRTKRLLINGITIAVYPLTSAKQTYTIGSGGDFNQSWPQSIELWSVVPVRAAAKPDEIAMGRPYTYAAWQQVRIKNQTAPYPSILYYDNAYSSAGLGSCLFHPIPTTSTVDVRLYTRVPAITALVAGTTYDLRPGMMLTLQLNLALELADRYEKAATVTPRLEKRAAEALASVMRANIKPKPSPIRPEYIIGSGSGRRTHNIYRDG